MNSGMVRKVDELGRVVIPKEMRRTLGINTGSSIEMSISEDGDVVLKKFSEISNMIVFAEKFAEIVHRYLGLNVLVCDEEKVLVVQGVKKDFIGKKLILLTTKSDQKEVSSDKILKTDKDSKVYNYCYIYDIKSNGFDCGKAIIVSDIKVDRALEEVTLMCEFLSLLLSE